MRLFTSARPRSSPAAGILSLCALLVLIAQPSSLHRLSASASQQLPAQPLLPGAPVERQLAGGETHRYQLAFGAEECVKIAVEQRGVDVALALMDPSGGVLREENRLGNRGTEWLLWISPGPGVYQLTVTAREPRAPAGTYQVLVEFSPAEEPRKEAFQKFSDGWRLVQQGPQAHAEALRNFEDALPYWRTTGDKALAAVTLRQIGYLNEKLKKAPIAYDSFQESLTLFRELGRNTEAALVLNDLGEAYFNQGVYPKALENFAASLAMADALSPEDAADVMFNHGVGLQTVSKHQDAIDVLERALTAFRALNKKERELRAISELGRTHYAAGEMVRALDYSNQGLALSRAYKMPLLEARFAQDTGSVFLYLEDYEKAREYLEQALGLFRAEKYVNGEIATLLVLGDAQYNMPDGPAAQESYETAARLSRATRFREAEARADIRLGTLLEEKGDFAAALDSRQRALTFYRETGNRRSEVGALLALGKTHRQMGNRQEASAVLQQGLQITRDAAGGFAETRLLGELALVARDDGHFEEAEEQLTALLGKFDAERRSLLAPSLSTTFGTGAQNWYGVYADLLMRRHGVQPDAGYDRRAWEAAEHAKAWGFLEMLAEARTDLHQGVDPALLEKRRRLWEQLSTRAASSQRSGDRSASSVRPDPAAKEITDLTVQLQLVETELRAARPGYVALVQPQPLATAALQQHLLDDDTVLLEFALGDAHSWLWAVTRNGFDSYALAPRAQIEADARRLYGLLTARQPKAGASLAARRALVADADARLTSAARDMSRLLLGPIESRLRHEWRGKRLVIVASGALEYLPFGALPLSAGPVLLAQHEVVNLPSASVLAALRADGAGRRPAKRVLALFADPVFDGGDPRVARAGRQRAASGQPSAAPTAPERQAASTSTSDTALQRAAGSFTRGGFARLPFSHEEAMAIAELVPPGSVLEATGFQASHAKATSGDLSQYRFVHFATHGLLNSRHPELSGLVLSLVDETGRAQNGFLRLQEIFNLQLGADVVVLSACQTALGKEIKGEGLVGLTRGFMYAGAQRVIASLWQVDDLATAELMKAFYRGMLKGGLRPAAALRSAQLQMMKQERWASPYYWSAFTLQGEWR